MSARAWRAIAVILMIACVVLWWRGNRVRRVPIPDVRDSGTTYRGITYRDDGDERPERGDDAAEDEGLDDEAPPPDDGEQAATAFGIQIPAWARWFLPEPGEDMLAYRDRLYPFARALVEPHRARVQRALDDFDAHAHLTDAQHAALDAAVDDAATAIEDKVMEGITSGDLLPGNFKPATGLTYARQVLDAIDDADQRFLAALTADQRDILAAHPFDFADYLLFHTHWEELIGIPSEG